MRVALGGMVTPGLEARDLFQSHIPPARPVPKLAGATGRISPFLPCPTSDPECLCCRWVPVQITDLSQAETPSAVFRFTSAMLRELIFPLVGNRLPAAKERALSACLFILPFVWRHNRPCGVLAQAGQNGLG